MDTITVEPTQLNTPLPPPGAIVASGHDAQSAALSPFRPSPEDMVPRMVTDLATAKAKLVELQSFIKEVMSPGTDFGIIPGTDKFALLKPGAEKLLEVYGYVPYCRVAHCVEDWNAPFFHYQIECQVISKRTGNVVGIGIGSCNSKENRYRWRNSQRKCPTCGKEEIRKGKAEWGGGYYCNRNTGGCGAKFKDGEKSIEDQVVGKVENDDVYTLVNTILKMAKKRALVDAALTVTRSSNLFVEEEEDDPEEDEKKVRGQRKATGANGTKAAANNGSGAGAKASSSGQATTAAAPTGGTPERPVRVMLRGQELWTAGVTASTLMRLQSVCEQFDFMHQPGAHGGALKDIVGKVELLDCTEEDATKFIAWFNEFVQAPPAQSVAKTGAVGNGELPLGR